MRGRQVPLMQTHLQIIAAVSAAGVVLLSPIGCVAGKLHRAISETHEPIPEELISGASANGDLNRVYRTGDTPLLTAISLGRTGAVTQLLRAGAEPGKLEDIPDLPLREAAGISQFNVAADIVRLLLEVNADPNSADGTGMRPLESAVRAGNELALELLIDSGADLDALNGSPPRTTAVLTAVKEDNIMMLEQLLSAGADPDLAAPTVGSPLAMLLGRSSTESRLELLRTLVEFGANVESEDKDGVAALALASRVGNLQAVEFLLEAGASAIRRSGKEGNVTALRLAALSDHADVVRILLQNGASPTTDDRHAVLPLLPGQLSSVNRTEIAEMLLGAGEPISATNSRGATALEEAAIAGDLDFLTFLVDYGAPVFSQPGTPLANRAPALIAAIRSGRKRVVAFLLEASAADNQEAFAESKLELSRAAMRLGRPEFARMIERFEVRREVNVDIAPSKREPRELRDSSQRPTETGGRKALVVGNSSYRRTTSLLNARADGRSIRNVLRRSGFEVTLLEDAELREFEESLREFGNHLEPGDTALFYYAGHAIQVDGENFLVPVDADVRKALDLRHESVPVQRILEEMGHGGADLKMVFLDACRDNPFGYARGAGRGIAAMSAPSSTLLSFATSPGEIAQDGDGKHSPYTRSLAGAISTPGLSLIEVIHRVQREVIHETGGDQRPWVQYDVIPQGFIFMDSGD
jgi:ankyrin repeat protein